MSTKIYYGFKFDNVSSIGSVTQVLNRIRIDAEIYCKAKIKEWLKTYTKEELWNRMTEAEKSKNNGSIFDLKLSITIFHESRYRGHSFYGIPFADDKGLIDLVLKSKNIKKFDYWNNSDKPDDVTDNQWIIRENTWNKIFSKYSIPSEAGYTKDIILNPTKYIYECN